MPAPSVIMLSNGGSIVMFYYSGTKEPVRINDWVSWYADEDARGYILTLRSVTSRSAGTT